MAKKKVTAAVDPANQVETAKVAEPATVPAIVTEKEKLHEKLKSLVAKRNESAEFSEHKRVKKFDEEIADVLQKYADLCETECFNTLKIAESPMIEAAKVLTYPVLKVKEVKQEDDSKKLEIQPASRKIDPLRLHKRVDGGIGADSLWWSKVERLNMLFTASVALQIDAASADPKHEKLDFAKIRDTAAMSEEAAKCLLDEDDPENNDLALKNVQSVMDAMIGDGYTATKAMVWYLRNAHTKGSRQSKTLVCNNAKTMRTNMLDVCNCAITGDPFMLDFKRKKED